MALPSTPARPFGSVLTAMVTPMTPDGEVNLKEAAQLAEFLVDLGNDGLVLSGTTGESPTTHSPEKIALIDAVGEAVGDRAAIVAGACSNDTSHAVRMAEQAAAAGADGILIVSPYYSRPTQDGLAAHFTNVADAGGLPAMIYDIPGRAGVRIAPETWSRIAQNPHVVAAKDATGDVYSGAKLTESTGLAWYCGDDGLLLPFLSVGGAGIVSVAGHAVADRFAETVRRFDAGDPAGALAAYRTSVPVVDALNGGGMQAVMAKAAAEAIGVISSRQLRLPNVPATEEQAALVRAALAESGVELLRTA